MKTQSLITILAAATLAACATKSVEQATAKSATSPMNATAKTSLGEVPAQQLGKGQCALVLWSRQSQPVRFLVTLDAPAVARVQLDGHLVELTRVSQSGQSIHGHFPEQRYRGNGFSLDVSFTPDQAKELAGGAVVSSAVVEYVDPNGWTTIIPAAGLIACQV